MAPAPAELPPNWTNHGDPNLICIPSGWTDVVTFLFVNFIAHCATVKPYPAETLPELSLTMVFALLLPSSGITRAMDAIVRRTALRKDLNQLQKAGKAGALCMVVRDRDWTPREGDVFPVLYLETKSKSQGFQAASSDPAPAGQDDVEMGLLARENEPRDPSLMPDMDLSTVHTYELWNPPWTREPVWTSQPNNSIAERECEVHGGLHLPKGYKLAYVPSNATIASYNASPSAPNAGSSIATSAPTMAISSSYSWTKAVIAIFQTVYASFTLYESRGDQLKTYGYAAFGLTVVPYILMSIFNLLGQTLTADYPTLFLVHSDIMDEAKARGGIFDGVIGSLISSEEAPHSYKLRGEGNDKILAKVPGPWVVQNSPVRNSTLVLESKSGQGDDTVRTIRIKWDPMPTPLTNELRLPICSPFALSSPNKIDYWSKEHHIGDRNAWYISWSASKSSILHAIGPLVFAVASITIVGLVSGFRKGDRSTSVQRGFVMSWLLVGIIFGPFMSILSEDFLWSSGHKKGFWAAAWRIGKHVAYYAVFMVPGIGGIVVVSRMIVDYGTCTMVGS